TEDGILFSHVANGHAVDPSIAPTAQGFPRRPAASPEVLGFAAGDLPPVGTIVRAPDGYHMVTDANGTTTPVTAKGHPREGSPSDLTTLGATDKWQVPKSQFSPELAGSLRGENTQLQEMVDQAILDPNNTRIDSQPTPDTYVMRFDTGRPTGTQNGADVNGIVISWRRGQDGTWLPESISPERVDSSPAAGRSTAADAAPIAQPHPGHHDDAAGIFGQGLPSTDAPGPNARRVIGPDGNPAIVFGRLPDGRLILGDGQGNRQAVDPALVVDGNRTDFAQDILPSGSRVNVRRTDGTFEQDWVVSAHNADGTVTVTRADGQLEKTIRSSDLFQQNAHRALGPDTVARTIHSNGTTSDGWIPTNTIGDEVVLVRPNERGQVEVRRMPASDFMALNSDRVLGANGSYPGTTPLRRGLGGDHDVPDLSVVEGRDFQRSGPGNIPEAGDYLFRGGIDVQHGNIRIRVETDPGTPSLVVRQRVEALQAAIDAMPPEMRANIRRVNVLEGRNPQDSYWAQQTGDANFRSGATAGGDTVNMFYGTEGDVTSLFAHEATHTFGLDGGPFHRNEWENAMAADAAHLSGLRGRDRIRTLPYGMQLDSPAISGYAQLQYDGALNAQGQRNVNEDWAETGGFTVQGERNGGIVATRRRWLGLSTQNYTMADLFPNRSAMFDQYRANIRQFGSPYGPPAGYHTPPQGFGPGAGAPGIAAGTPNGSVTGSSVFTMLTQPGFTAGLHTGAQSAEDDEARG
ncbi:MAG: hypothetical protein JWM86_2470, partial [Thermoleophilia bacterium]|nr:hypothetical protein [Thermoleophilia bacterium]